MDTKKKKKSGKMCGTTVFEQFAFSDTARR